LKRGTVLFVLSMMLRLAIAQNQAPATTEPKSSGTSSDASAERIYGPKDGAKPPKVLSNPDPEYPKKEWRNQGTVVLFLVVDSNGLTREIKVVRSLSPGLDQAAVEAVRKWRFAPGTKDGKPVAFRITVEILFRHN
jgi:periplasmic protein TonB